MRRRSLLLFLSVRCHVQLNNLVSPLYMYAWIKAYWGADTFINSSLVASFYGTVNWCNLRWSKIVWWVVCCNNGVWWNSWQLQLVTDRIKVISSSSILPAKPCTTVTLTVRTEASKIGVIRKRQWKIGTIPSKFLILFILYLHCNPCRRNRPIWS